MQIKNFAKVILHVFTVLDSTLLCWLLFKSFQSKASIFKILKALSDQNVLSQKRTFAFSESNVFIPALLSVRFGLTDFFSKFKKNNSFNSSQLN